MKPITKEDILAAFQSVGLVNGCAVMVHTSLSGLGYVCGGAQTVIEALIETVGEEGTIMMPTQSWKNLDPEDGVHGDVEREYWPIIRDNWPAYDKRMTPTNTMGAVAEMFRSWPGTLRSDHPARSVAAWGKHAEYLTANHDFSDIFGESSPLAKLYALDGDVLLIGVGYDKNTSLHLADVRAETPTAAAVLAVPDVQMLRRQVRELFDHRIRDRLQLLYHDREQAVERCSPFYLIQSLRNQYAQGSGVVAPGSSVVHRAA